MRSSTRTPRVPQDWKSYYKALAKRKKETKKINKLLYRPEVNGFFGDSKYWETQE